MRTISETEKAFLDAYQQRTGVKLTADRQEGVARIVEYGIKNGYTIELIAYALATTRHETAGWYLPIREGAARYGKNYTDAQSRRAVKSLKDRGIIRIDYSIPINGKSYYGRGLVQITWLDNYRKFGKYLGVDLENYPDLALEWHVALPCLFSGIDKGMYTGKKFSDYAFSVAGMTAARAIVNGDVKANGPYISRYTMQAHQALAAYETALRRSYIPKIDFGALFAAFAGFLKGVKK